METTRKVRLLHEQNTSRTSAPIILLSTNATQKGKAFYTAKIIW